MRNIATKVARQLCDYLNKKGLKTECDFVLRSIDMTLRSSWYVDKVKQCGHTDAIHVGISHDYYNVNGFFAVLENGDIMTGGNIMINDAFTSIDWTIEGGEFVVGRPYLYHVYECDDDVCIITSLKGVKAFVDRVEFADADDDKVEPF